MWHGSGALPEAMRFSLHVRGRLGRQFRMLGPLVPGAIVESRVIAEIAGNQVQCASLLADEAVRHYPIPRLHACIAELGLQLLHRFELARFFIHKRIVVYVSCALYVSRRRPGARRFAAVDFGIAGIQNAHAWLVQVGLHELQIGDHIV